MRRKVFTWSLSCTQFLWLLQPCGDLNTIVAALCLHIARTHG